MLINENQPDAERALSDPAAVENVIRRGFVSWFNTMHTLGDVAEVFPQVANEMTNTQTQEAFQWSVEPRVPFENDQLSPQIWIPRYPYDNFSECTASVNDGLRIIKNGMKIETADVSGGTTRGQHGPRVRVGQTLAGHLYRLSRSDLGPFCGCDRRLDPAGRRQSARLGKEPDRCRLELAWSIWTSR